MYEKVEEIILEVYTDFTLVGVSAIKCQTNVKMQLF